MSNAGRDELTEFVDEPSVRRPDPGQYVLRSPWYYPVLLGGAGLLYGLLVVFAQGVAGILSLAIIGTLAGVVLTLVAMAWGVAIVFAEDTRKGLWFVIFPPYMAVYAALRWKWMAQPSVMFLCGLALAGASLWTTQRLAATLGEPRPNSGHETYIHDSSIRVAPP
jgi:hypothetical protein